MVKSQFIKVSLPRRFVDDANECWVNLGQILRIERAPAGFLLYSTDRDTMHYYEAKYGTVAAKTITQLLVEAEHP